MLNQSIEDYLPNNWNAHPSASALTWLHVLSHRTGYPNSGSDFATVRNMVENNTATANATFQYSNGNYGLIRILLASLTGANYTTDDANNDNLSQGAYIEYTTDKLFTPAGITTQRTLQNNVRYYNTGDDNMTRGWPVGDRRPNLGAGGYYLSALDYARFMAFLLHSEDIISEDSRELMFQFFLGLADGPDPRITPTTGLKGTYFTKAGALSNAAGQGCRNILMIFPNEVEIVILGNTSGVNMDNTATFRTMVANAYDNAWE
jgi:CubicO group peptidase (beta-lactamase class C family)